MTPWRSWSGGWKTRRADLRQEAPDAQRPAPGKKLPEKRKLRFTDEHGQENQRKPRRQPGRDHFPIEQHREQHAEYALQAQQNGRGSGRRAFLSHTLHQQGKGRGENTQVNQFAHCAGGQGIRGRFRGQAQQPGHKGRRHKLYQGQQRRILPLAKAGQSNHVRRVNHPANQREQVATAHGKALRERHQPNAAQAEHRCQPIVDRGPVCPAAPS